MRALLLVSLLALSAVEGLPASAQRVVEVPVIPAGTAVHPTLAGSLNDPSSPIFVRVTLHKNQLMQFQRNGFFDKDAAAKYLEKIRGDEPLDRVAANVITQELAAEHAGSPVLDRLVAASKSDADAAHVFDGSDKKDGTESLVWKRESAWTFWKQDGLLHQGKKVKPLGQGGYGIVYANPVVPGQVVKFTALSLEAAMNFAGAEEVQAADIEVTRYLASKGLGPRLLAVGNIDGRVGAVKERIYGKSVQQLIWDRKYDEKAHAMVMDFIAEMAKKRVRVGDMNPSNLMIGRTLVNHELRVYHIDGGTIGTVKPEETEESLKTSLYHQAALFKKQGGIMGMDSEVSLSTFLERGLARSKEKNLWQKFAGFIADGFINASFPDR